SAARGSRPGERSVASGEVATQERRLQCVPTEDRGNEVSLFHHPTTPPPLHIPMLMPRLAPILAAVLTVAVTGAALASLTRIDRARWDVPLEYDGDSLLMQAIVQTALERPWYLATPRLGAPDGQAMYDYPCADTLDILLVKTIG